LDTFLIGNTTVFSKYDELKLKFLDNPENTPIRPPFSFLMDQATDSKALDSYDHTKHELSVAQLMEPYVIVQDPIIV